MRWRTGTLQVVLAGATMAVLGVAGAVALSNHRAARERQHQNATMAGQLMLATALEAWGTDNGPYPTATNIDALEPYLVPTYLRTPHVRDGWGSKFAFRSGGHAYIIASSGADGRFNGDYVAIAVNAKQAHIRSAEDDLIYSNGGFIRYPKGVAPGVRWKEAPSMKTVNERANCKLCHPGISTGATPSQASDESPIGVPKPPN